MSKITYKLTRKGDGKTVTSHKVSFVEFDEQGRGKAVHEDMAVDRSCLMGNVGPFYDWMTTIITEVVDENNFKTLNSEYTLEKIIEEDDE